MTAYEYKVVPAPTRGRKAKGVKSAEGRFAHSIEEMMNAMAADGWEYQRAETLPSTERAGLTGTTTQWRNLLVFRRKPPSDVSDLSPELLPAPEAIVAAPVAVAAVTAQAEASAETGEDMPIAAAEDFADADLLPEVTPEPAAAGTEDDAEDDEGSLEDAQDGPGAGATHMLSDNGVEEISDVSGMSNSLQRLADQRKTES